MKRRAICMLAAMLAVAVLGAVCLQARAEGNSDAPIHLQFESYNGGDFSGDTPNLIDLLHKDGDEILQTETKAKKVFTSGNTDTWVSAENQLTGYAWVAAPLLRQR